jgi:hypothetical protein
MQFAVSVGESETAAVTMPDGHGVVTRGIAVQIKVPTARVPAPLVGGAEKDVFEAGADNLGYFLDGARVIDLAVEKIGD